MGYAGWIPTISGRLSFSMIGNSTYPTKADSLNLQLPNLQYIVARQRRDLNDYLFPRITTAIFGVTGKFEFYIVARSKFLPNNFNSPLIGKVFVLRADGYYRNQSSEIFEKYETEIKYDSRAAYLQLHKELTNACLFETNFILRRNGFLTLRKIEAIDNSIEENSRPLFVEAESNLEDYIANQVYFFLRDISHQHKHHGPDSDTLIGVYQNNNGRRSLDWTREVVFALHSYVIRRRREEPSEKQTQLPGILAYIKSFKKIVNEQAMEMGLGGFQLPPFDEDLTKASIEASRSYFEAQANQRRTSFDNKRTVNLWVVTVVGTLLSILLGMADQNAPVDPNFLAFANYLKANPWVLFAPFMIAFAWWTAMTIWVCTRTVIT